MQIDIEKVSKDAQSCYYDNISSTSSKSRDNIISTNVSTTNAQMYYQNLSAAVAKSNNYNDLITNVNNVIGDINGNTAGHDKDILLVCAETAKSSAYIWFSKTEGGSGIGSDYLISHPQTTSSKNKLNADMSGAGYGMVVWSFSAFLGPVGMAGFLYDAVSGALVSSFLP